MFGLQDHQAFCICVPLVWSSQAMAPGDISDGPKAATKPAAAAMPGELPAAAKPEGQGAAEKPAQAAPENPAKKQQLDPPEKQAAAAPDKQQQTDDPKKQQGTDLVDQPMKFDFEAEADDFMDMGAVPAPDPPAEPALKRRRKQMDEVPGRNPGKEARLCAVCETEPCVPKFTYCKECKKDVQSCLNSAKAEGKEDDFRRLTKTAAGLKHLISHYKSKCPSRGQGVPRDAMNWVSYLKVAYSERRVIDGSREVFMDFPDFEIHMKGKGKTAKETMEEWADMEARNVDHDFKGRKDFEKRFCVAVEDYRLREKVQGDREDWDWVTGLIRVM